MKKVILIAEAGPNHNGKLKLAYKLVDIAKKCGADFVKFQTSIPEMHISRFAQKASSESPDAHIFTKHGCLQHFGLLLSHVWSSRGHIEASLGHPGAFLKQSLGQGG